jgi:phage shock protein PspC (stress-responsive transcriptional regulator)
MNTVNIFINGLQFRINATARTKLTAYLYSLQEHLKAIKGGNEILQDVQCRLAELFQEKFKETHQSIISESDVESVIAVIGTPADLSESNFSKATTVQQEKVVKKFYRDSQKNVLGGVCAGIGNYYGIPPNAVRILFLASLFVSGYVFLIYCAFWLLVPLALTRTQLIELYGKEIQEEGLTISLKNLALHTPVLSTNFVIAILIYILFVTTFIIWSLSALDSLDKAIGIFDENIHFLLLMMLHFGWPLLLALVLKYRDAGLIRRSRNQN